MGWFDGLADAIGGAANWVGSEASQAANWVGQGISDIQARSYGYPDAAAYNAAMAKDKNYQTDVNTANQNPVSNYLSQNPAAAAAFNAVGGVGYNNGGSTTVNTQGTNPYEGPNTTVDPTLSYNVDHAVNTQNASNPTIVMPVNQGGFTPAPSSPLSLGPSMGIQPSNSLGKTPIDIASPQSNPGASFPNTLGSSASSLPNPSTVAPQYVPVNQQTGYTNTQNPVGTTINGVLQTHATPVDAANAASASNGESNLLTPANALVASSALGAAGSVGAAVIQGNAAKDAAAKVAQANADAIKVQQDNLTQTRTDADPWLQAGSQAVKDLSSTITNHHDFGSADFQQDPGYAFRLSEGMKALNASAAAKGMLFSGNTMDAATKYGQDMASQEYQNSYNRYQTNYGTKLNALQQLSGTGQTAVGQVSQAGQNYATNAGQYGVGAANALAQGTTGAAGDYASGALGVSNAVNNGVGNYINYSQNTALMNALKQQNYGQPNQPKVN